MKIHCVPQGKILNTPQKKKKSGFLIKIIIYPETLHLNSLKSSASSVDQQTRSKLYWCPAYVCAECLPVLRLSAKLLHPIPAFSDFVGEIHALTETEVHKKTWMSLRSYLVKVFFHLSRVSLQLQNQNSVIKDDLLYIEVNVYFCLCLFFPIHF